MGKAWRRIAIVSAVLVVAGMFAGIGWIAWWVNDNIGAPGPGPTGKGACTSADAVNLELVFTDGHAVQACTHDRPACPNQTVTETEMARRPACRDSALAISSGALHSATSRLLGSTPPSRRKPA